MVTAQKVERPAAAHLVLTDSQECSWCANGSPWGEASGSTSTLAARAIAQKVVEVAWPSRQVNEVTTFWDSVYFVEEIENVAW